MANLHVPSTAAVLSLQQQVWSPQGEGCCLGGPPVTHKLGSHSASWMSPRGVGLDVAAFRAQCMFCGDAGQLRPYSAITLLATQHSKVTANQIAWPQKEHFANLDVHIDKGPGMGACSKKCSTSHASSLLKFPWPSISSSMTRESHALIIPHLSLCTCSSDIPYRVSSCFHSGLSVLTMGMC